VLEYLSLLEYAEKHPDLDVAKKRGILSVLHPAEQYMSKEEHDRYEALANQVRRKQMCQEPIVWNDSSVL